MGREVRPVEKHCLEGYKLDNPISTLCVLIIVFVSPAGQMAYVVPLHMHWMLDLASSHTNR